MSALLMSFCSTPAKLHGTPARRRQQLALLLSFEPRREDRRARLVEFIKNRGGRLMIGGAVLASIGGTLYLYRRNQVAQEPHAHSPHALAEEEPQEASAAPDVQPHIEAQQVLLRLNEDMIQVLAELLRPYLLPEPGLEWQLAILRAEVAVQAVEISVLDEQLALQSVRLDEIVAEIWAEQRRHKMVHAQIMVLPALTLLIFAIIAYNELFAVEYLPPRPT